MITAGSVYIKSGQATAKDVLVDLLEMVKGVQHPQRGLFLRYYLAQKCKDKLPDVGSPYEGIGGTLDDAINFIATNFGEMNRLWVRMQHAGAQKNRKRRERERLELRILVGGNLNRLGSLNGVDVKLYTTVSNGGCQCAYLCVWCVWVLHCFCSTSSCMVLLAGHLQYAPLLVDNSLAPVRPLIHCLLVWYPDCRTSCPSCWRRSSIAVIRSRNRTWWSALYRYV